MRRLPLTHNPAGLLALFRLNVGDYTGFGHLIRCISLAEALEFYGISCILAANSEAEQFINKTSHEYIESEGFDDKDIERIRSFRPDFVVFDSYTASSDYVKKLSEEFFLVQFDDNNDVYGKVFADVLINGNVHASDLKYVRACESTLFLLGPEFLALRKEYWNSAFVENKGDGILITTGGADFHGLMPELMQATKDLRFKKRIVIGPAYNVKQIEAIEELASEDNTCELIYRPTSLRSLIEESAVVMTSSGSTIYQVLTLRRIPILFVLAENQKFVAKKLQSLGVPNLGWYEDLNFEELPRIVESIYFSREEHREKLTALFSMFDGKGALRIAEAILSEVRK